MNTQPLPHYLHEQGMDVALLARREQQEASKRALFHTAYLFEVSAAELELLCWWKVVLWRSAGWLAMSAHAPLEALICAREGKEVWWHVREYPEFLRELNDLEDAALKALKMPSAL